MTQAAIAACALVTEDSHQGKTMQSVMNFFFFPEIKLAVYGCRGPAFAPSGLYGKVQLQAYNTAIITGAPASIWQFAALRSIGSAPTSPHRSSLRLTRGRACAQPRPQTRRTTQTAPWRSPSRPG